MVLRKVLDEIYTTTGDEMKIEIGNATLYLGDCMDILPTLGKVDAVITDPPYGVLSETGSAATRRSGGNLDKGRMAWDIAPNSDMIDLICSAAPVQAIWGGCHLHLPPTVGYLIWDKQIDGLNFGEVEFCWTNQKFAPRQFHYRAVGIDGGKVHPTQKPIALMTWCINQIGNPQTILDPFMGSGTTGVAAIQLGRKFIGIEREPKYFEIACKRIEQAVAQGQLFAPEQPKQTQETLI